MWDFSCATFHNCFCKFVAILYMDSVFELRYILFLALLWFPENPLRKKELRRFHWTDQRSFQWNTTVFVYKIITIISLSVLLKLSPLARCGLSRQRCLRPVQFLGNFLRRKIMSSFISSSAQNLFIFASLGCSYFIFASLGCSYW